MAFHGGSLELATDVIAAQAAEAAGASLYTVAQPWELRWHLPSHHFDPSCSANLRAFVDHVDVAVAVHGWGSWRNGDVPILLGGRNRTLAAALGAWLRERIHEHRVEHDVDRLPHSLRGLHRRNPVNLPRRAGVQLELPPRVRGLGPHRDHALRTRLIDALASFALSC
jgi:phage replication-related protein YjqB (UPF0714/DUF867 family)